QGNTILLEDGRPAAAFNTDVHGIVQAFADAGVSRVERGVVLGGGATAESAVAALSELGAVVTVAVRNPAKAAGVFGGEATIVPLADVPELLGTAGAVVSTIPNGADFSLPIPARVAENPTRAAHAPLLDVAYHPWPSALASRWAAAGGEVVSGLEMLLHQAVHQIRIFVSGDPSTPLPEEARVIQAMRSAVE